MVSGGRGGSGNCIFQDCFFNRCSDCVGGVCNIVWITLLLLSGSWGFWKCFQTWLMFEGCFRIKKAETFNCGETMIGDSLLQKICKYEGMWYKLNQLLCAFLCCCFWIFLGFFYCNEEVKEKWTAYETTLDDYSLLILSQGLSLKWLIAQLRARRPTASHWGFFFFVS